MVIEHAVDDGRRVVSPGNHTTRPRRDSVMAGQVHASQVDGLVRRGASHGADIDAGKYRRAAADDFEVQVVIQRRRGAVFALQQLRQIKFVGAWGEVGDEVVAVVAFEPLEGVGAAATGEGVVAQTADQEVVATPTLEDVVAQTAVDDVAVVVACQ